MKTKGDITALRDIYPCQTGTTHEITLFGTHIRAGFPSPADDFAEDRINLNTYLIEHPESTYYYHNQDNIAELLNLGIIKGDLLTIDTIRKPKSRDVVLIENEGEPLLSIFKGLNKEKQTQIHGVATYNIKALPKRQIKIKQENIDLNRDLIRNPLSTYFSKVEGQSMKNVGILEGDILVIDKEPEEQNGDICVCCVENDFTVKRIKKGKDELLLLAENEDFEPIRISEEEKEVFIWGIVKFSIQKL